MSKHVYIAGPYAKGDCAQNVRQVILAADVLATLGFVPFAPHLSHFWHLMCPHKVQFWYDLDLAWLRRCDCLLRLPGESAGAEKEVAFAIENGITVYGSIEELLMAEEE